MDIHFKHLPSATPSTLEARCKIDHNLSSYQTTSTLRQVPLFEKSPTSPSTVLAFSLRVHAKLVRKAIPRSDLPLRERTRIVRHNLRQDRVDGQFHPEYHADGAKNFTEVLFGPFDYVRRQREILQAPCSSRPEKLAAFGRMSHAIQDFYAHSNYVEIYAQTLGIPLKVILPADIPIFSDAMRDPRHIAFRNNLIQGLFTGTHRYGQPHHPLSRGPASHRAMHKDYYWRPGYYHAFQLALRHTRMEWEQNQTFLEDSRKRCFAIE